MDLSNNAPVDNATTMEVNAKMKVNFFYFLKVKESECKEYMRFGDKCRKRACIGRPLNVVYCTFTATVIKSI